MGIASTALRRATPGIKKLHTITHSMNRRAFIFDMDGTIIDSMPTHVLSWIQALDEFGHKTSTEELHKNNWGNVYDVVRSIMGDDLSDDQVAQIAIRKEELFRETYRSDLRLIDGLDTFLDDAKRAGILMALATNAGWDNISYVLDGLGIGAYFDTVISGMDVNRAKPDPEMFLKAACGLKMEPTNCIVFEDSANGITAASAAGMRIVLVKTFHKSQFYDSHPSIIRTIRDYREIEVDELFEL